MPQTPTPEQAHPNASREGGAPENRPDFYCPTCAREVDDPLTCGDCSAVICRVCGTPLEAPGDLGVG